MAVAMMPRGVAPVLVVAAVGLSAQGGFAREASIVPLQAIRVADDDGRRAAKVTPEQFKQWVDFAQRTYAVAGIAFEFHPGRDFSELTSTLLNNTMGTQDPNWLEEKQAGNEVAARFSGKLVVLLRHGRGDRPTGAGFSWFDYNFVVMPGFDDASHCGHPHVDAFAHEVGHFLGLPHTFAAEPFPTIADAEAFFKAKGSKQNVFDGDGFSDTLPDPAIRLLECQRTPRISLGGSTFVLPRANIMSYYDERDTISPMQARRVRWILQTRARHGMAMPSHRGVRSPLEAEQLEVEQSKDCRTSVQSMSTFGAGSWSGEKQLFCAANRGGTTTLLIPVAQTGKFRIDLYATQAPDFGRIQIFLDGQRVGVPLDTYAPVVMPSGRISLGTMNLGAGSHRLRCEAVGKNVDSQNYRFGLDCIELVGEHDAR